MNKSYRSIYNETTGTYVAVQETARAKGKRSSSSVAVCAASLLVASTMGLAAETPEFASVTVGATGAQTQLSSTGANQLQIGSTGAKPITVDAATGVTQA